MANVWTYESVGGAEDRCDGIEAPDDEVKKHINLVRGRGLFVKLYLSNIKFDIL